MKYVSRSAGEIQTRNIFLIYVLESDFDDIWWSQKDSHWI